MYVHVLFTYVQYSWFRQESVSADLPETRLADSERGKEKEEEEEKERNSEKKTIVKKTSGEQKWVKKKREKKWKRMRFRKRGGGKWAAAKACESHLQSFRYFEGRFDCTFVARVQLRFQIPIAKILFAALDDKGCVSRVARHAEDERLGLRRRQLFMHAPSSRVCTSFRIFRVI